jgi:hypothetical protein
MSTSAILHAFDGREGPTARLDLGVGGAGIVGRGVSVLGMDGRVWGVGVVGWGR